MGAAAERLSRYSGDEIAFLASPRASNEDNYLMAKLARTVFRSPNIGLASDQGHGDAAEVLLEGTGCPAMLGALTEIRKADLILVVGADIAKLNPIVGSEIHQAARGGAHLVTLSSRSTQIAKLSGTHLWTKPGVCGTRSQPRPRSSSGAADVDEAFLRDRTEGFADFARYLSGLDLGALTSALRPDAGRDRGPGPAPVRSPERHGLLLVRHLRPRPRLDRPALRPLPRRWPDRPGGLRRQPHHGDLQHRRELRCGRLEPVPSGPPAGRGPAAGRTPRQLLGASPSPLKALVVADRDEEIVRYADRLKGLECVVYVGRTTTPSSISPTSSCPRLLQPRPTGPIRTPSAGSSSTAGRSSRRRAIRPAWRIYTEIAAKVGA
ncbi:MAG: molybdopterin-dependent oxidoreductase [Candidatus Moduliflexus flocculans]|nr:molybdopterin-dependent oxidoreductase [Candidatus Moduliflexus flocculans]